MKEKRLIWNGSHTPSHHVLVSPITILPASAPRLCLHLSYNGGCAYLERGRQIFKRKANVCDTSDVFGMNSLQKL